MRPSSIRVSEIAPVVHLPAALPGGRRHGDGVGVARQGVHEFRMERAATQLPHLAKGFENRGPSLMISRNRRRTGDVPHGVLANQGRERFAVSFAKAS